MLQVKYKEDMLHQLVIALQVEQSALLWVVLSVGVGNLFQDESKLCMDKDGQKKKLI